MQPVKTWTVKMVCLVTISFLFYRAPAQVYTNDAGTREKHFIYEVKQIDEFFERFNNDTGSFIRKAYKNYHVRYSIDRAKMLKSLFNYETNTWDQALIDQFVRDQVQSKNTGRLDFEQDGWFAEARCKFQYNGAALDVPLILRISTDDSHRSKWVIAAVKSNVLKTEAGISPPLPGNKPRFINPASHANSFIALDKALGDKEHLADYFDPLFFTRHNALSFYDAVLNDHIRFLYVKDITYHFLQAGKWIFTVEYFPRESLNAGWLINSLRMASEAEKDGYRRKLLEEK